jgi:hypothetical protein
MHCVKETGSSLNEAVTTTNEEARPAMAPQEGVFNPYRDEVLTLTSSSLRVAGSS